MKLDTNLTKEDLEKLDNDIYKIRKAGHEFLRLGAILENSLYDLGNVLNTIKKGLGG